LAAVAKDFKVFYKRVDGKTPGKLPIRTTPLEAALFDGNGKIRLFTVMAAVLGCWPLTSSSDQNATAVLARIIKSPELPLGLFLTELTRLPMTDLRRIRPELSSFLHRCNFDLSGYARHSRHKWRQVEASCRLIRRRSPSTSALQQCSLSGHPVLKRCGDAVM
jgi:hypothetical protein